MRRLAEEEEEEDEDEEREGAPLPEKKRRYTELQKMLNSQAVSARHGLAVAQEAEGAKPPPKAAAAAPPPAVAAAGGPPGVVDLETIGYMALKRLVIEAGVPKAEASMVPGKAHLKELAVKYGCAITFT